MTSLIKIPAMMVNLSAWKASHINFLPAGWVCWCEIVNQVVKMCTHFLISHFLTSFFLISHSSSPTLICFFFCLLAAAGRFCQKSLSSLVVVCSTIVYLDDCKNIQCLTCSVFNYQWLSLKLSDYFVLMLLSTRHLGDKFCASENGGEVIRCRHLTWRLLWLAVES